VVRVHTHPLYVDIEDVCVTYHADILSAIWTDLGILGAPYTPYAMVDGSHYLLSVTPVSTIRGTGMHSSLVRRH